MKSPAVLTFRLTILGIAALISSLAAQSAQQPDAKMLYSKRCSMCHGADGKGFAAIKTPDFTDSKWQASVTDKQIFNVIKEGKKDTAMKAFGDKLTDDEIQALVTHIRSLNGEKKKN